MTQNTSENEAAIDVGGGETNRGQTLMFDVMLPYVSSRDLNPGGSRVESGVALKARASGRDTICARRVACNMWGKGGEEHGKG